jgi:hypothetical protein
MATDRLFNQTQGDSLLAILAQIRDGYNSVDGAFSLTSENPLQNKKITGAVTDIIETLGGTAQKSYAIGQYFLANDGYYYVATAAITAGSSNISSSTGGNCSKTCITAAMNNLSSQISNLTDVKNIVDGCTFNNGLTYNAKIVVKIGNLIYFGFSISPTVDFKNNTTIVTLPNNVYYFSTSGCCVQANGTPTQNTFLVERAQSPNFNQIKAFKYAPSDSTSYLTVSGVCVIIS